MLGLFLPAGSFLKRTLDVERGFLDRLDEKPWGSVSDQLTRFRRMHDFTSLSRTAAMPFPREGIPRDARQRQESLRSVSDRFFWVSLDPAPPLLWPRKGGLSVRFATLAQNYFFEIVNTHDRIVAKRCA